MARQLSNLELGILDKKSGDLFGMKVLPMAMSLANSEPINNVATNSATFK